MSRARTREQWRQEVHASRTLKNSTKLVLLALGNSMLQNLRVSVPRDRLAREVGKVERTITRAIGDAHKAGFLSTVSHGRKGSTAVYQGTFPDRSTGYKMPPPPGQSSEGGDRPSETRLVPLDGDAGVPLRDLIAGHSGTHGVPPVVEPSLFAVSTAKDKSSKEELDPAGADVHLTRCPWHEMEIGRPEDCACTPAAVRRTA